MAFLFYWYVFYMLATYGISYVIWMCSRLFAVRLAVHPVAPTSVFNCACTAPIERMGCVVQLAKTTVSEDVYQVQG